MCAAGCCHTTPLPFASMAHLKPDLDHVKGADNDTRDSSCQRACSRVQHDSLPPPCTRGGRHCGGYVSCCIVRTGEVHVAPADGNAQFWWWRCRCCAGLTRACTNVHPRPRDQHKYKAFDT